MCSRKDRRSFNVDCVHCDSDARSPFRLAGGLRLHGSNGENLDEISRNERDYLDYLVSLLFWYARGKKDSAVIEGLGLKPLLASKLDEIDPKETSRYSLGRPEDGEFRDEVFVRDGRFGPYIEQGERKASIPNGLAPDEMTLAMAMELLSNSAQADQPMGYCPDTGKPIFLKNGRFGPTFNWATMTMRKNVTLACLRA